MLKRLTRNIAVAALLGPLPAAASFFDQFIDPLDGQLDASTWLIDNRGFLPVPIIITERRRRRSGGRRGLFP